LVYQQQAQISADDGWLSRFEQPVLIHPEGEEPGCHQPRKICVISEICGFIGGCQVKPNVRN
jgi:hypothetical protein